MGEEVREPRRTIPRAIMLALAIALALYLAVAVAALATLGAERLASSTAPLADVATASGWHWAAAVVRAGAGVAALGALLALLAGVSRTALAMARTGDLPERLAAVHPRAQVPRLATAWICGAVVLLVILTDVRTAIGFSSFGVLLYYFIANLAAWRQTGSDRRYPKAMHALGAAGCAALAVTLPVSAMLAAAALIAVGVAVRALRLRKGGAGRP